MTKAKPSAARAVAALRAEEITRILDTCPDPAAMREALANCGPDGLVVLTLMDAALGGTIGAIQFWLVNRLPESFRPAGNPRHQTAREESPSEPSASPFEGLKIVA